MSKNIACFLFVLGVTYQVTCLPLIDADEESIDLSSLGSSIFGEPDEAVGKALEAWNAEVGNPEELGTYAEGDILVPSDQQPRNGMKAEAFRWPNGTIPFVIAGNFNPLQLNMIEEAFNEYHKHTCVRFVPRMIEPDYISIENTPTGCWSSVGRVNGKQIVNLQTPSCMSKVGTTIHELLHAIGFLHEQNRADRDDYVSIQWYNIPQNVRGNFDKAEDITTTAFDVPYDYGSVMHYSAQAFSNNGRDTIVALKPGADKMGQREGLSESDITKVNRMYKCNKAQTAITDKPETTEISTKTKSIYTEMEKLLNAIGKDHEKVLRVSIETKLDEKLSN